MSRRALGTILAILLLASAGHAQQPPPLTAPVNDFAGVIDPTAEAELDALIRRLQAASGDVIVVATIQTIQPEGDIRVYANRMFENHGKGIGQKGRDNGLLVLLAVDDRRVWTEVGYDLEPIITDGFAGETSRQTMAPHFSRGDYGRGLVAGVNVFARRIADARNVTLDGVPVAQPAPPASRPFPAGLVLLMFLLFINLARGAMNVLFGSRRGRRRRRWGSMVGPFGAGYGGWHAGRGGWGGGGWSGGGGFGGGFGGFGGGRSGGGGGGASW